MSKVNERQVALRKTTGTWGTLDAYMDRLNVIKAPFNTAGPVTVSGVNGKVIPVADLPAGAELIRISLGASNSVAVKGGIIAPNCADFVTAGTYAEFTSAPVVTDGYGNITNLVEIREATSNDPVFDSDGKKVYGLFASLAGMTPVADGADVAANPSENLVLYFVVLADSGDTLQAPAEGLTGTYEYSINRMYAERQKAQISMDGGARDQDIIADLTGPKVAQYTVTTKFNSGEDMTLSTGEGVSPSTGASTESGDYTAIGAWLDSQGKFDGNNTVVLLNGVEQVKGIDVEYSAADTITLNFDADVDDVITIKAKF